MEGKSNNSGNGGATVEEGTEQHNQGLGGRAYRGSEGTTGIQSNGAGKNLGLNTQSLEVLSYSSP